MTRRGGAVRPASGAGPGSDARESPAASRSPARDPAAGVRPRFPTGPVGRLEPARFRGSMAAVAVG